ncbi:hypothetical protein JKF63_01606 [Porcisia hertigi]|uniref:Uncharacterized protein n=1 Tax=Porcisia hertigi TaxID=2761500 RepID=A0A836L0J0_9TRYP|nr:hypothetical protein JKF63_01606 [Porcisia hertigi]
MHVEIRLCEVEKSRIFDSQCFYRVKQLLSSYGAPGNSDEGPVRRGWNGGSLLRLRRTPSFVPELKLQVTVERIIEMESRCFGAKMDAKQDEARTKSNWNNSAVGTAYYSAEVNQVILAALPPAAADSVVKIRLLQLPPPLDYEAQQIVKKAVGNATVGAHRHDTPLCIGVAKISLRELMSARRTVRIAMQAKRSLVSSVEAHNLDTLATNAMFGRGESTGSAVLFLQVNGYMFGRVPKVKLILGPSPTDAGKRVSSVKDTDAPSALRPIASSDTTEDAAFDVGAETLNSSAIRSVLLPYVAFIDVFLRVADIASWRVPHKTGMALVLMIIALYSDLFDVLLVLVTALAVLCGLRNISLLQSVPARDCTPARVATSRVVSCGAPDFQPFLYSRENAFLNSLLRARVFFSRGLMEDTYYELALSGHLMWHNRRQLVAFVFAVCCSFVFLSMGTVVIFLLFGAFTVYPVFLNMPSTRPRSRRRRMSLLESISCVASAIRVPRRTQVVRVTHVAVVRLKAATQSPRSESIASSTADRLQQRFLSGIRQRNESVGVRSPTEGSEVSLKTRENSAPTVHRRVQTMDGDVLPNNSANFASTLDRFQATYVMRYFVALCFSPSVMDSVDLSTTTASWQKPPSNAALQRRLCDQLRQARILAGLLSAALPQSDGISTGGTLATFPNHGGFSSDSKAAAGFKEMPEVFQHHFNGTLTLLFYLRQQWTFHSYVTQSSTTKCMPDSMRSVCVLARLQDLIDAGEDDGVTRALMARRNSMPNPPVVGGFSSDNSVEVSGRVMALYAAYLLQGARLSVYMSSNGCATVLPLLPPGNRMERFPQPNPCPPDLLNTLDSVWRGETNSTSERGKEVYFNADAVLQIITVYKDYWERGGSSTTTRPLALFDSSTTGENHFTNAPSRNSIRNTFVSLSPLSRPQRMLNSTTSHYTRSPKNSTAVLTGLGPAAAGSAAQPRGDSNSPCANRVGDGKVELTPPRFSSSTTAEPSAAHVNSGMLVHSALDVKSVSNSALDDPPTLEQTRTRGVHGQVQSKHELVDNLDLKHSGTRASAGRSDAVEMSKTKR